jgi:hypothetical protein
MQQFSIKTMKIDGSLIEGLADPGGVSRAMVETIVHVSHSLGICTVAESVETALQVKILRELGADVGQGYFFAKPLAVGDALMLTTMDPLPVFPLGMLDDEDDDGRDEYDWSRRPSEKDSDVGDDNGRGIAGEVRDALDAVQESDALGGDTDDFAVNDEIHIEASDVSLVSKRGRLLASFRKGRSG